MLHFTENDKKEVKDAYQMILIHLKDYLQQYSAKNELEYSKIFFKMLHSGFFCMNRTIIFDNWFHYIDLPSEISQGIQVMYGTCCCRHANEFLYSLLCILEFNPAFSYIWVNHKTRVWHKVNPAEEKANHLVILLNNEYILDAANQFILQIQKDGALKQLDSEYYDYLKAYQDDNIHVIGKILKKYYIYQELGVENVY